MAPIALKKLTANQASRAAEIELMFLRIKDKSRDSLSKSIMQARLDALNKIWSEARSAHAEIVGRDDSESDPYITDNVFATIQGKYEDALDEFLKLYGEFETLSETSSVSSERALPQTSRLAKLPKLDLPTFSGNYEDWESFRDLFTSLVHEAPDTADATKLQYLKSCLTGSAARLVKDVPITNASYSSTWASIKSRFDNPRYIVNTHLKNLMNLENVKKESSIELSSFADEAERIIRALTNLKMPVEHWDPWLVYTLSSRLDSESRKLWESELSEKDILGSEADSETNNPLGRFPKFSDFLSFLHKRVRALSMSTDIQKSDKRTDHPQKPSHGSRKIFHSHKTTHRVTPYATSNCPFCSKSHPPYKCYKLKAKSPKERRDDARRLKLCFNCLGSHKFHSCPSNGRCSICNEKHHSLLHLDESNNVHQKDGTAQIVFDKSKKNAPATESRVSVNTASLCTLKQRVLLATAKITVLGQNGKYLQARALLDQGAEASFISESIVQLLQLPKHRTRVEMTGLGNVTCGIAKGSTILHIQSITNPSFRIKTEALVLPRLTSHLPASDNIDIELHQFADLSLADPHFFIREKIDIILGAEIYGQLLKPGLKRFSRSGLVAQDTELGWVLSGPLETSSSRRAEHSEHLYVNTFHVVSDQLEDPLSQSLQRFWNVEEVPESRNDLKPEDEFCENLFIETHTRNSEGRYVVKLPLRSETPAVGESSRRIAAKSLSYLHRRFARDPELAKKYCDFMYEYEKLGHMIPVPESEINNPRAWYIPHHAVITNKIRVVFDASRKTPENHCLNDFLLPGPALQNDLSLILLNWRRYRFVFTADIVKMFRQILVALQDQDLQRILWSPNPKVKAIAYRLSTVTYGTGPAPWLAIRVLLQLAADGLLRFPLAARCIRKKRYVDDIFEGDNDLDVAIQKREELINLLRTSGIELDKWAANHQKILPPDIKSTKESVKQIDDDDSIKTLGIQWSPSNDKFTFNIADLNSFFNATTKRSVLSHISRLFDPLGWLAPVTVKAKILMQDLWILKCEWDSPLPKTAQEQWFAYCNSLRSLSLLSVNRWLGTTSHKNVEIHGFSDASIRAYAAVVYLRIPNGDNTFQVSILAAKTKVAPVKTVSIPNLELCGAVLLVKLIRHIMQSDFFTGIRTVTWTDSQIVLDWIRKHPRSWKTFVANRVSFIQTELPATVWKHVSSKDNPADLASHGSSPAELANSNLWWHGPSWLAKEEQQWPAISKRVEIHHVAKPLAEPDLLTRYSSLTRLTRVISFMRRPIISLRRRKNGLTPLPSFLTSEELAESQRVAIKLTQSIHFSKEIATLKANRELPKKNKLRQLKPFLDKATGLLCVGGRLTNANLSFNRKHPPILPQDSALSRLFIDYAHKICLHGGLTLTSSKLNEMVWVLGKKRLVKNYIHKCIACQRVKPHYVNQLMGDLPADRVTSSRPFLKSGLDYAGPIQVRTTKGRGYRSYKGYIALFVCFSTRAVHLEVVSDLTSQTFLNAFRRFVGRRGRCNDLYSDNATTFHGADAELQKMFTAASKFYKESAEQLSNDGTYWKFIPANSPHCGGLWEAGIKSVKHHLKRVIGEHTLTFEELSTLLVDIEACLNSRPLSPLTSEIDDLDVLTPAHFLIGEPTIIVPNKEPPAVAENRLSRYQLQQRMLNDLWKKWSTEYLHHLQERSKWRGTEKNFAVGELVLIHDDKYPPAKWPRGRVIDVHPGVDGLVRVVTVKTANGSLRRHIVRLSPLDLPEKPTATQPSAAEK